MRKSHIKSIELVIHSVRRKVPILNIKKCQKESRYKSVAQNQEMINNPKYLDR